MFRLPSIFLFVAIPLLLFSTTLQSARAAQSASTAFQALLDEYWEFTLRENPLLATAVGDRRYNDRLPSVSLADSARRDQARQDFLQRLEAIQRSELEPSVQINYDILRRQLSDEIAEFHHETHLLPITQRSGFHVEFPELRRDVPLEKVEDYENYIARLRQFGEYTQGHIELLREGIRKGKTLPAITLNGWEEPIDAQIVKDPAESLLYEPLKDFPSTVSASDHERLRQEAREAILEALVPGYQRLRDFLESEYVPQARGSVGASAIEGGREFYRHRVRMFTTLETTPEEVHQIGLSEVERIRDEMDTIIESVEFEGEFSEFLEYLRSDPQFYAETEGELLRHVSYTLKKMDGKLPALFGRLPRMPYGLREVPDYVAPYTTAAYYMRPAGDGTRAGFFYMNTYKLDSRPLYTVEALSLHEAVPGHHLQIALQQEMEDLPMFRRFDGFTAFVEGWALYAERLGLEADMYEDPYSDFGRLTFEMWRACRLVVDTGIHYFGWSRNRAIDYLQENSSLTMQDIRSEVDRYITWPGQALAYKTGEMKIRQLRAKAEEQLGEQFDIRAFHDVVLGSGSVPLDVLERNVNTWLAEQSQTESIGD